MRILLWIVRVLAVLLLVRMLLHAIFGSKRPATQPRGPGGQARAPERIGGELVRDPQCGTYIPKARALVEGTGDTAVYFCSPECKEAYAKR